MTRRRATYTFVIVCRTLGGKAAKAGRPTPLQAGVGSATDTDMHMISTRRIVVDMEVCMVDW